MSWLKIDDGFAESKRIAAITDRALRLHLIALCYCARNLTDGRLDERGVKIACAILDKPNPRRYIAELVEIGLWLADEEGGYELEGYLEYNPDADTVREERRKARIRMQELRKKRAGSEERSGERDGERSPTSTRPVPSVGKPKAVVLEPRFGQANSPEIALLKAAEARAMP